MRIARWVIVAHAAVGLVACGGSDSAPAGEDSDGEATTISTTWSLPPLRKIDLLLVIDDSPSMAQELPRLAESLEEFATVLDHPGLRADYRVGVVTTSRGAACEDVIVAPPGASCLDHLDDFEWSGGGEEPLQFDHRSVCEDACGANGPLTDDGLPWIASVFHVGDNAVVPTSEAFACLGLRGIAGCRFESPLAAARETLEASMDELSPWSGFVRRDSALMVAIITDEDDCGFAPGGEGVLSPTGDRVFWSDPDGVEATSAVCWNAGTACDGDPENLNCAPADFNVAGEPAATPSEAVLVPASEHVAWFQGFADDWFDDDAAGLIMGYVSGVRSNGDPHYALASEDDPAWADEFGIDWGCSSDGDAQRAAPNVRLRDVAAALGGERPLSVCDDGYEQVLEPVADVLPVGEPPKCFDGCAATLDGVPDCEFSLERGGEAIDVALCEAGQDGETLVPEGAAACVEYQEPSEECLDQERPWSVSIAFAEGQRPEGDLRATCVRSETPEADCPLLFEDE